MKNIWIRFQKKIDGFEDKTYNVRFVNLGEVAEVVVGGDVPKENFSEIQTERYKIPIFSNGVKGNALYGYTDKAKVDKKT